MTITSLSQLPPHLSSVYNIQRGGDGSSGYSYSSNHSGNTAVEADDIIATFTDELQKMRLELEQEAELEMAQAKSDLLKSLKRKTVKNVQRVNVHVETEEDKDDKEEEDPYEHVQVQGNDHDIPSSQEPFKDESPEDDIPLHNLHDEEEYEIQYEYEEIELEEYDDQHEQLQEKMDAHSIDVDNCDDEIQIGDSEDLEGDAIVVEEDVPEKNVVEEEVVEKTPKAKKKDKPKKKNKQNKKDKKSKKDKQKSTRNNQILEQQLHLEKKKEEESTLMILVKSLVPVLMVALLMILSHLFTQLLMKKM
jgi:hypothetical protein